MIADIKETVFVDEDAGSVTNRDEEKGNGKCGILE